MQAASQWDSATQCMNKLKLNMSFFYWLGSWISLQGHVCGQQIHKGFPKCRCRYHLVDRSGTVVRYLRLVVKEPFSTSPSYCKVSWCSPGRLPLVELPEVCGQENSKHTLFCHHCLLVQQTLLGDGTMRWETHERLKCIMLREWPLKSWHFQSDSGWIGGFRVAMQQWGHPVGSGVGVGW